MPCKSDIKQAILDKAFSELTDGRNTFRRISDDTIQINSRADNSKTRAQHQVQANAIARDLANRVKQSFNGHVIGEINQHSEFDPITVTFIPSDAYINHEYSKITNKTDGDLDEQERDMVNHDSGINTDSQLRMFDPKSDNEPAKGVYPKYVALMKSQMETYKSRLNKIKQNKQKINLTTDELNKLNKQEKELKLILYGNGLTGVHEIKGLKQEIADFTSKESAQKLSLGYYIEKDLDRIAKLTSSNNIDDLTEADRLIKFYDLVGTFSSAVDNPFFTKEEIFAEDENGNLGTNYALSKEVMNQYKEWRDRALGFQELVTSGKKRISTDGINQNPLVKATYGKDKNFTFDELTYKEKGLSDTDFISMWTMDMTHGIGSTNGLFPQVSSSILRTSIEHKEAWARGHTKNVEDMLPAVQKELIRLGHDFKGANILGLKGAIYNLFKQVTQEGNETHDLVTRYTREQQNAQNTALNEFEHNFSNARAIEDYTNKRKAINSAFEKLKRYKRDNQIMVDIDRLDDADYKTELTKLLGERGYKEQVDIQKDLLNKYQIARQDAMERVFINENKFTYDELSDGGKNTIKLWETRHDPKKGMEDYNSVSGISFGEDKENNYMDFNSFIPRKYVPIVKADVANNKYTFTDTAKETGNYDKNFALIESNSILSDFYDKVREFCEIVHDNMPPDLQDEMSVYTLPSLAKTTAEMMNDKNTGIIAALFEPFRRLLERIKMGFGVVRQSEISYATTDPITGKANYKVNDNFLRGNNRAVHERMLIEQTKFLQAFNPTLPEGQKIKDITRYSVLGLDRLNMASLLLVADYLHMNAVTSGSVPTQEQLKADIFNRLGTRNVEIGRLIADFSVHSIVQSQSFDLPRLMRYYGDLTMAYAARQEALPILNIMREHYESIENPKTQNLGRGIFNKKEGKHMKIGVRTNALKQFDEQFERVVLGNTGFKHIGVSDIILHSKEDKGKIAEIDKLLENETDPGKRAQLQSIKDNLGKVVTLTAAWDNILNWIRTLRLGYNISSAITNFAEGIVSNMILGASNEYFEPRDLLYGYSTIKHSMLKNASFGFAETPIAKKVRSLVDKLNVIIDNKNELQKSSHTGGLTNRIGDVLAPMAHTARVEYINQTPLMIALLRTFKIKDNTGKESSVWDAYDNEGGLKEEFKTPENIQNWEELSGEQYQTFVQKLNAVIVLGHGNYDTLRGMLIKSNSLGKAGMMFKTWLPEQFFWRFAKEQDMIALGKQGFKGRYLSYSPGSALIHGATAGLLALGPIGALVGGAVGLGAGMFTGVSTGEGIVGVVKESLLTLKQLVLKAVGMPVNLVSSMLGGSEIIGDNALGKNAFEKWVGKGTFTKQDEYNMKANMADVAIQLAILAMILAVKKAFWDDNDKKDAPERMAHNILMNKLMSTGSQLTGYVNLPATFKNTIGTIAVITYIEDGIKLVDKFGKAMSGNDITTSGPNAGKSGVGLQLRKMFLPGMFKDLKLGFGTLSQGVYPDEGPWHQYFHSAPYYQKQELKTDRAGLRGQLKDEQQFKNIKDDKERDKAINKEILRRFPPDKKLEKLGETRDQYEKDNP